jgi:hypothetical protein
MPNIVNQIIEYENGNLNNEETIELFQELVDTGMAWELQGSYGRMAEYLIQQGVVQKQ